MDLKKYLYLNCLSQEEFSRILNVHRVTLCRAMNTGIYSERLIARIEDATGGKVTKKDLEKK